jgi:hypothetical protein
MKNKSDLTWETSMMEEFFSHIQADSSMELISNQEAQETIMEIYKKSEKKKGEKASDPFIERM